MARIRTIKPEFQQSESMGRVSRDARLLFILLWPICDDEGRTRANPRMLSSLLFPYDDDAQVKIVEWLFELEREKCVRLYSISGNAYLQIENWKSHQRIDKAFPSRIAPPPIQERSRTSAKPKRERSALEWNGMEGTKDSVEPAAVSPPAISIPTNRKDEEFPITAEQVLEFAALYPNVDIGQELREMRGWSIANQSKRKTSGGMLKFVNSWLAREQDKGQKNSRAPPKNALGFVDSPAEEIPDAA